MALDRKPRFWNLRGALNRVLRLPSLSPAARLQAEALVASIEAGVVGMDHHSQRLLARLLHALLDIAEPTATSTYDPAPVSELPTKANP
jgi:hypothetical protein